MTQHGKDNHAAVHRGSTPATSPAEPRRTRPPAWIGYVITIALEVTLTAGLILTQLDFPLARFPVPYVLIVMLVAYFFGGGPAILAFFLGLLAFDYFFVPPLHTIWPLANTTRGWASLIAFLMGTSIVGFATVLMQRARRRIQRLLVQVEGELAQRKKAEEGLRESEERLCLAQKAGHVGVFDWDITSGKVVWTPELEKIFGIPTGSFEGSYEGWAKRVHPDDVARLAPFYDEWMASEREEEPWEYRFFRPDGEMRWMAGRGRIIRDKEGRPLRMIGTNLDVTERKRAEEALRESQRDLNHAQAVAHIGSWRLDIRRNELLWSDEAYRIFDIPKGTPLTYETFLATVHPEDRDFVDTSWKAALSGEPYDVEHRIVVGKDVKWVRERAELEFDKQGELIGGFGTVQDITDLKEAEKALEESEERYRTLFENLPVGIGIEDPEGTTFSMNRAGMRLHGFESEREMLTALEQYVGAFELRCLDGRIMPVEEWPASRALRGEFVRDFEARLCNLVKGHERIVSYTAVPLRDSEGKLVYITYMMQDLTERKKAEEALRKSEERYRTLFGSMTEGFVLLEVIRDNTGKLADLRFLEANPALEALTNLKREEIIGKTAREVLPALEEPWLDVGDRVSRTGEPARLQLYFAPMDRWYDVYAYTPGKGYIAALFHDITQIKQAEAKEHELEEHKLEFYRRTIQAATDGKLVIADREEIGRMAGPPVDSWEIRKADDVAAVRHGVEEIARQAGMEKEKIERFVVAIGEAATNALKHVGMGMASLHRTEDGLVFVVSDTGHGIPALTLPQVALRGGYSTAGTLGIGYKVMIGFADRIYLATGSEGTCVAVEMKLHPVEELPAIDIEWAAEAGGLV